MHSGTVNSYWEQVDSCVMRPTNTTELQSSTMRRFGGSSQNGVRFSESPAVLGLQLQGSLVEEKRLRPYQASSGI